MIEAGKVAQRLRDAARCPMWADHAEVSKNTLTLAAHLVENLGRLVGYLDAYDFVERDPGGELRGIIKATLAPPAPDLPMSEGR
jgi:hypothetical protein